MQEDYLTLFNPGKNINKTSILMICHGLNLRPDKMDSFSKEALFRGSYVLRLSLPGHVDNNNMMGKTSALLWQDTFRKGYLKAKQIAKEENLPINFLGFSLGGLLGVNFEADISMPKPKFNKMLLIAPALVIPWYTMLLRGVSFIGRNLSLPSRSPQNYRAYKGTTIEAYNSLLDLKKEFDQKDMSKANIKTLVIIDKDDELISYNKLKKLIEEKNLSNWQLATVKNKAIKSTGLKHLLIDEESAGKDAWREILSHFFRHFYEKSP